jgi:hypothetical protein
MNTQESSSDREWVLLCFSDLTGKINHIDKGPEFCRPTLMTYLGIMNEYVPSFQCGDKLNTHICINVSKKV